MARLRHRDLHTISGVLLDLYAATDLHAFGDAVAKGLRRLVPADRCSFNYIDPLTKLPRWISAGVQYPMSQQVFAAHIREHPIAAHIRDTGDQRWNRLSDHTTREAFRRSALYNEWYRPLGIEHQLITLFPDAGDRFVAVALSRGSGRDFSDRDRSIADVIMPHLIAGCRAAVCAGRVQQEIVQLSRGLESAHAGIILLAEDGRLKLATALARQWLAEYFGNAACHSSGLPMPVLDWVAQFACGRTQAGTMSQLRAPLVIKAEGRRLVVQLIGDRQNLMLLLSEEFSGVPPQRLEPLGLTQREAEVLAWVAEGKRDSEIAMILAVSPRTVNHHLERVYRKLGVETRTAAAARALEVVPTRA
jgi:DNA-binding CsgD family transcriptional regulator